MSTLREVDDGTFDAAVLQSGRTVVVDFWAEWCAPCRALKPILEDWADAHAGNADVVLLNIDDNPDIADRYQIVSLPAIRVFRGGEIIKSVHGAKPRSVLEQELLEVL